ncbi:MAG TPA: hypothetical protein VFE23_12760 [Usitatibacter sp.]|jgi:hypothetical protein|nr:hypothetical protein [Usitatibacter sp.]
MTLIVVDPAVFIPSTPGGQLIEQDEIRLQSAIDHILAICEAHGARIPTDADYWRRVETRLVQPLLVRTNNRRIKQGLVGLRNRTQILGHHTNPSPGEVFRVWGLWDLFRHPALSAEWLEIMERVVVRAAIDGRPLFLATARLLTRNVRRHASDGVALEEVTRWRVAVQLPNAAGHKIKIPCVQTKRQIDCPWTTRFDQRLPHASPQSLLPFCPPARWWDYKVAAVQTIRAKPCFVDCYGNGWTRPRTGGGYHWDVFLRQQHTEHFGLDHLNICEHGLPANQGVAGRIHHVPPDKAPHLKANPARVHCP